MVTIVFVVVVVIIIRFGLEFDFARHHTAIRLKLTFYFDQGSLSQVGAGTIVELGVTIRGNRRAIDGKDDGGTRPSDLAGTTLVLGCPALSDRGRRRSTDYGRQYERPAQTPHSRKRSRHS